MFKFSHKGQKRHARDSFWHEGRGHHHRGHDHHHRGRRARIFDQGDLRLIMLDLIAEAPRHGYEIIKLIEERVGGAYSPSPGVVYPTLTLLEEMGFATVGSTDGARKHYAITPEGRAHLDANRAGIDTLRARMDQIGKDRGAPSPQIERAVENLRTALRLRLERGLNEGDGQTIADVLDGAAKAIEKS